MAKRIRIEGLGDGLWPVGPIADAAQRALDYGYDPQMVADRLNAYGVYNPSVSEHAMLEPADPLLCGRDLAPRIANVALANWIAYWEPGEGMVPTSRKVLQEINAAGGVLPSYLQSGLSSLM